MINVSFLVSRSTFFYCAQRNENNDVRRKIAFNGKRKNKKKLRKNIFSDKSFSSFYLAPSSLLIEFTFIYILPFLLLKRGTFCVCVSICPLCLHKRFFLKWNIINQQMQKREGRKILPNTIQKRAINIFGRK